MSKIEKYWKERSAKYNNLEWVSCGSYLDNFCTAADLNQDHIVLDIGAGTGVVGNYIKKYTSKVFALDVSSDMLKNGEWRDVSLINWDVRVPLFGKNIFDRITARMVFHHILKDQDKAFENCYNYLKKAGKIIIAEAVPPSSSTLVINWYTDMFEHKEDRITFVPGQLEESLKSAGFLNIQSFFFFMPEFSINNWLDNSGLSQDKISKIIKIHLDSPQEVKDTYDMRINGDNILINSKYTIVVGDK